MFSFMFKFKKESDIQNLFNINNRISRLLDEDMAVSLFSLDQVWDGKGYYLAKVDSPSLHSYLPLGSPVKVMVR